MDLVLAVNSFVENLDDADTLVQLLRKNVERHTDRAIDINKDAFHVSFSFACCFDPHFNNNGMKWTEYLDI